MRRVMIAAAMLMLLGCGNTESEPVPLREPIALLDPAMLSPVAAEADLLVDH